MKRKLLQLISPNIVAITLLSMPLYAEQTKSEKVGAEVNKASDSIKNKYRTAQDKVCEMINGEMKCIKAKVINKAKNFSDDAHTKAKELGDKID